MIKPRLTRINWCAIFQDVRKDDGQWRRGLAYKSGGLGVAGSNPVCPKCKRVRYQPGPLCIWSEYLDLKRSVKQRLRWSVCSGGGFCRTSGRQKQIQSAIGKSKSSLPVHTTLSTSKSSLQTIVCGFQTAFGSLKRAKYTPQTAFYFSLRFWNVFYCTC